MATATQSSCQKPDGLTLRGASWLIPGGGDRILQRDHEQVLLSLNAFALKHVCLKKSIPHAWMATAAFIRLVQILSGFSDVVNLALMSATT